MLSKPNIKYIQSLAHKKLRDEGGVFVAEGPKVVAGLLHSGKFAARMVCALPSWIHENEKLLKGVASENKIEVSDIELEKISQLQTPNKVVAVLYKNEQRLSALPGNFSLMLDGIQDPGNMGTIIRTADWFGIPNIICSHECADCYNPKVVQASMGSLARVNIVYSDLEAFIQANRDVKVYAATLSGKAVSTFTPSEGILLIGNEGKGVNEKLLPMAAGEVTIPRKGAAESLNAAVACGIILSHWVQGKTL